MFPKGGTSTKRARKWDGNFVSRLVRFGELDQQATNSLQFRDTATSPRRVGGWNAVTRDPRQATAAAMVGKANTTARDSPGDTQLAARRADMSEGIADS